MKMIARPGCFPLCFSQSRYYLIFMWVLALPVPAGAALDNEAYQERFAHAQRLSQNGDLAAAAAVYEELIQQAPQQPAAFNNLAAIRARQGMLAEAQSLLEQALRNHPDYAAVYENLSAVYVEMARDSYGKALRLDAPPKAVSLRELTAATLTTPFVVQTTGDEKLAAIPGPQSKPAQSLPAPAEQAVSPPLLNEPPGMPDSYATPAAGFATEAVVTTLQGWAAAWSEQATELYLVFYTRDYHPEGMSRQRWEAQRRERLKSPQWIQVELSDIEVQEIKADQARVRLIQEYRADNYQDRTLKEFQLRLTADGWRISSEESISQLN